MNQETEYTVKEASELLGVPTSTLRYWDKIGLVQSHRKSGSNYRTYSVGTLADANNISFYRQIGVSLKQLETVHKKSLRDIVELFSDAVEDLHGELTRTQGALWWLEYQRALSQYALDLMESGVRKAVPTALQLRIYNANKPWQSRMLIQNMQRYSLYIDVEHPEKKLEVYIEYPEDFISGQYAEEQSSSVLSQAEAIYREHALELGINPIPQEQLNSKEGILWNRSIEERRGVHFFEGVGVSNHNEGKSLKLLSLFDEVRKQGYEPLYAIANYLLSADMGGRKDFYRVWIGAKKEGQELEDIPMDDSPSASTKALNMVKTSIASANAYGAQTANAYKTTPSPISRALEYEEVIPAPTPAPAASESLIGQDAEEGFSASKKGKKNKQSKKAKAKAEKQAGKKLKGKKAKNLKKAERQALNQGSVPGNPELSEEPAKAGKPDKQTKSAKSKKQEKPAKKEKSSEKSKGGKKDKKGKQGKKRKK